jgi:hypothetical protein
MKISIAKLAATTQSPVFQTVLRKTGAAPRAIPAGPRPETKGHMFAQSRDWREDHGARQMRPARDSQTFQQAR